MSDTIATLQARVAELEAEVERMKEFNAIAKAFNGEIAKDWAQSLNEAYEQRNAAEATSAALALDNERLREALEKAAATFRRYEKIHMEKGSIDGDVKARANGVEAEICETALSHVATDASAAGRVLKAAVAANDALTDYLCFAQPEFMELGEAVTDMLKGKE